jgi:tryptophan halogenase
MNKNIESLVILGGGSAGWMTAAMLSHQLNGEINITLVESDQIGTIGVGEATIPPIQNFNRILGIDESEFLSKCNGSIKLGIEFENWGKDKTSYMHPFGKLGVDVDYIPFPYFWLKSHFSGNKKPIEFYSLANHLAKQNKFIDAQHIPEPFKSGFDHAYHFDAGLYAAYLRGYAEQRGVQRVEGRVTAITQHSNDFIQSIILDNGEQIHADFFVDCSGQKALLLSEHLGVGLESWQKYLINNSAIAIQTAHMTAVKPYTRSIAHDLGWQWRIPLQTRVGNGIVYSDQFSDDEQALNTLLDSVEGPKLTEPNNVKFETGVKRQVWKHNCLAIGLSAGFLEPLESTSLHLIQTAIMRLVRLFPDKTCSNQLQHQYNAATKKEYESIRDFIILHYKATQRADSPYWQYCREMPIPDSLAERLSLYKEHGHLDIHDKELFKQDNWLAVLLGQFEYPMGVAPIMLGKGHINSDELMLKVEQELSQITSTGIGHESYLMKYSPYVPA